MICRKEAVNSTQEAQAAFDNCLGNVEIENPNMAVRFLKKMGYDIRINYSALAGNSQVQDKIRDIAGSMVSGVSKLGWLKEAAADGAGFAAKAAAQLAPDKIEKKVTFYSC